MKRLDRELRRLAIWQRREENDSSGGTGRRWGCLILVPLLLGAGASLAILPLVFWRFA